MASPHIIPNARHIVISVPIIPRMSNARVVEDPAVYDRVITGLPDSKEFRGLEIISGSGDPLDGTSRSLIEMFVVPTAWGL